MGDSGLPDTVLILVGVVLIAIGSSVIAGGLTLQKWTHVRLEAKATQQRLEGDREAVAASHFTHPAWYLGVAGMVGGEIFNFLAYGFAPASLVTPLGAFSVIMNAAFNTLLLKERLGHRRVLGILISLLGATAIVLTRILYRDDPPGPDGERYVQLLLHIRFIIFFSCWLLLIVVQSTLCFFFGKKHVAFYVGLCSLVGGIAVALTKAIASMLVYTFTGRPQWLEPSLWISLALMPICAVAQIHFLNLAMRLFDNNVVVPTYYVFFTATTVVFNGVLYDEFNGFEWWRYLAFVGGCCVTAIGVVFVAGVRRGPSPAVVTPATEVDEAETKDGIWPVEDGPLAPEPNQGWTTPRKSETEPEEHTPLLVR